MTPSEMRQAKLQAISEAARGLGWEAEVEIDGFEFVAMLSAKGASGQIVEGKLSKALTLIEDFGGPELYSLVEEYDLVPLGVKDDLDEFVTEHDAGEEDAADAMCGTCEDCGIEENDQIAAEHEFGDGRYTSSKETWAATQVSDTPQNEYEHQHGGPTLAHKEATVNEGYVKTATRIIAEEGFVVIARPQPKDQAEGFKVQRFASINLSHAATLRGKFGYSINIAAL